jgi:PAS domain S-box-containing protein
MSFPSTEPFYELLSPLFDSSPVMMGIVRLEENEIIHLKDNPAMERFLGLKPGTSPGTTARQMGFTDEQIKFWLEQYKEAEKLGKPVDFSERVPTPNGDLWFQATFMYLGEKSQTKYYAFMAEDVTDKRSLLENLRTERERFALAVEGSNAGLWDWDPRVDALYFSKLWKEMLGYREEEIENTFSAWEALIHPEDRKMALDLVDDYLAGNVPEYRLEHRLRCKDGSYRWILSRGACIKDHEGKTVRFTGWHIDIHQLRATIEELKNKEKIIADQQVKIISSAKMSSLGEMAGGIAHEINNPLAIIGLSANQSFEALAKNPPDLPFAKESLEKIRFTVKRIGKIIKGLRSFSRSGEKDPFEPTTIKQIVEDTLELCRERFATYQVKLEIPELPNIEIECRAVQISQVLLNLLNNSLDSVVDGKNSWVKVEVEDQENKIHLIVTDSGSGIPAAIAERMMEPFFTTKEVGFGTGLGLSISKGIVEDHHGNLDYDSSSVNTRFVIRLPKIQGRIG